MPRATNAPAARRRRNKYIKAATGYRHSHRRRYRTARESVERAGVYAYRDRKARKREFRKLWIVRINAASRAAGLSYSQFIRGLKLAKVDVDRKNLAELAATDETSFEQLVEIAKSALDTP